MPLFMTTNGNEHGIVGHKYKKAGSRTGFIKLMLVTSDYGRLIASEGHASAQVPHSVHISGSIE